MSSRTVVSSHGSAWWAYAANTRTPACVRNAWPGRRISSTLARVAAARSRSSSPMPVGQPGVAERVLTPGPGVLESRNARTVEAVPAIGSARASLAAAQRKVTRSSQ